MPASCGFKNHRKGRGVRTKSGHKVRSNCIYEKHILISLKPGYLDLRAGGSIFRAGSRNRASRGPRRSAIADSCLSRHTFHILHHISCGDKRVRFVCQRYVSAFSPFHDKFFGAPASPLVGLGNILHSTAIVYLVHVALMIAAARLARKNAEDPTVGSRTK